MALTAEQMKAREGKLTASMVGMLTDPSKTMRLWQMMVGDPSYVPDDLSRVWPVRLGETSEQLQLDWYEMKTGAPVTRRGEVAVHATVPWAAATLDGWDSVFGFPIECKHVGGREPREVIIARYQPQCHWQMIVTKSDKAVMSIIEGANEPVRELIPYDPNFGGRLWETANAFMRCVETLTPPGDMRRLDVDIKTTPSIVYDMDRNNQWASFAVTWLDTREAAARGVQAERDLKEMVPPDARRVHGHGVEITRDRANRLRLREAA